MIVANYTQLLQFFLAKDLVRGEFFDDQGRLKLEVKVYQANLIATGQKIFGELMIQWFKYIDRN